MRVNATKAMIRLATSHAKALEDARATGAVVFDDKPICSIVAQAVEVGVVVPSILEAKLNAAGFHVADARRHTNGGSKVLLTSGNEHGGDYKKAGDGIAGVSRVVGHGRSHDRADALLQAVFSIQKEENGAEWSEIVAEDKRSNKPIGVVAPVADTVK